jgi:hypothetical protein
MVAPVDTGAVLALRAQILARSTTLGTAVQAAPPPTPSNAATAMISPAS